MGIGYCFAWGRWFVYPCGYRLAAALQDTVSSCVHFLRRVCTNRTHPTYTNIISTNLATFLGHLGMIDMTKPCAFHGSRYRLHESNVIYSLRENGWASCLGFDWSLVKTKCEFNWLWQPASQPASNLTVHKSILFSCLCARNVSRLLYY